MAGFYARRSLCRNSPPVSEDELAAAAPTESSGTPISIPILSHVPTPAPAIALTATSSSDNKLFKQFIKAYLEAQVSN